MGTPVGRTADILTFFAALADEPYRYDFFQTLRRLECLHPDKPRWGEALRPIDEPIRLGQNPDLSFAPAAVASFKVGPGGTLPRLQVRMFGLFGPNGPLPIHLTEYAHERMHHHGDATLSRFLDLFHHRFLALFYRAWAQAQPHVNRDRPHMDRYAGYIASFFGIMPATLRRRDAIPDVAKLFQAGNLVRHVRNREGLADILRQYFRVGVAIEEFVGHWMLLGVGERTFLAREGAVLGAGAVVGKRVWDCQHKFRIRLGSLTLKQYVSFLPGGVRFAELVDWVRFYLSFELDWDVRLVLRQEEVPRLTLDRTRRLGWTTWLGTRRASTDADDLCLHAETVIGRIGVSAA